METLNPHRVAVSPTKREFEQFQKVASNPPLSGFDVSKEAHSKRLKEAKLLDRRTKGPNRRMITIATNRAI